MHYFVCVFLFVFFLRIIHFKMMFFSKYAREVYIMRSNMYILVLRIEGLIQNHFQAWISLFLLCSLIALFNYCRCSISVLNHIHLSLLPANIWIIALDNKNKVSGSFQRSTHSKSNLIKPSLTQSIHPPFQFLPPPLFHISTIHPINP